MKKLIILLLFSVFVIKSNAQINQGGIPKSFTLNNLSETFDVKVLEAPDLKKLQKDDDESGKQGGLRRVGQSIFVGINLNNSGTWEELPNGDRIWRLKIVAGGALAMGVYYNHFWLPPGARLFLYNEDKTQVKGAYSMEDNPESGLFATELISGENTILEYYEPSRVKGRSVISISEIAYVYRDFKAFGTKDFLDSESCEVNVNCSEGAAWQDQKKGVARISIKIGTGYYWCSGTLLNNQRQDCTPYFLTADHCGEGASAADMTQWIFYFNYESATCPNPTTAPVANSLTGCTLKANGGTGGSTGSDFYMIQLTQTPTFNPYFNGWDHTNTSSTSGVGIHHPSGDIKKISTYTTTLTTSGWNGSGLLSHWQVVWAATANGHGVTEGGSSGSPIFNSNGVVIGDLTGGGSYCTAPTSPDFYGKLYYSWDLNGTTPATRIKDWLDPDNTGVNFIAGKYCSGGTSVTADFIGAPLTIPVGGSVNFTDLSTGSPTSWTWTFTGGTPASSTVQNPTGIVYNTAGIYTVSLSISNGSSSDVETKTNYITVGNPPPVADFTADVTSIPVGGTVNFTDLSSGNPTSWSWTFTGGTPANSTTQNPTLITYNTAGLYPVSLTATNASGSNTATKTNYINVGGNPGTKECDTLHFPLPGNMVMYSIRYVSGAYGYISGNNGYSDMAKADFFAPSTPYNKLIGVYFKFGKAKKAASHTYNVPVKVWNTNGPGGAPGDVLEQDTLSFQQIFSDVTTNKYTFLQFATPMDLSNQFYVGVELPQQTGDTIVLLTNKNGQTIPGTAWEQWRDGTWYAYSDSASWRYNVSNAIFPVLCQADYGIAMNNDESLSIYPNPSNDRFTVDFGNNLTGNTMVKVFNSLGALVKDFSYSGNPVHLLSIDLSDCNSGIYFVNISNDNRNFIRKLSLMK
jgi:PKD repeat protein